MEKYFANYNQSLALKELGFDEPCFAGYRDSEWIGTDGPNSRYFHAQLFSNHQFDNDQKEYCSAPLKSQVFEWFRKEHAISGEVTTYYGGNKVGYGWSTAAQNGPNYYSVLDIFSYEEAESACIDKLIELIKSGL